MVLRDRRSSRMSCSQRGSRRRGHLRGRDERSWRPAAPSRRCRVLHFLAVFLLIPAAPAAAATLQSSCSIRATSNARLDGQVRALLWRFIRWAPCGWWTSRNASNPQDPTGWTAPSGWVQPIEPSQLSELYKHPGGGFRSGYLLGWLVVLLPVQRHRNQLELLRRFRAGCRSATTDASHLHQHEDGRSCSGAVFRRLVLHTGISWGPDVHKLPLTIPPPGFFRGDPVASPSRVRRRIMAHSEEGEDATQPICHLSTHACGRLKRSESYG